jgi:hypothetical protein
MAAQTPVCLYNKYGFCKHREMCHVNEMCEKLSCEFYKCTLRHPKICKFFWNNGHCKFDPCAFLHKDNENSLWKLKQENEILQEKINNIDKALQTLNQQESETQSTIDKEQKIDSLQKLVNENTEKFEKLEIEIERKFQCFEESLNILKKCVSEKDMLINALENKLNEKPDKNATKVNCNKCDFEGNSKHGLKGSKQPDEDATY